MEFIHGGSDFWILGIDSSGGILWQKSLGGSLNDLPHSIIKLNDEELVITGYSNSIDYDVTPTYGSLNVWTVKLGFVQQNITPILMVMVLVIFHLTH